MPWSNRTISIVCGKSSAALQKRTDFQSTRKPALRSRAVRQDSFSRVEGLVTSVQIHSAKIDENIEGIVPVLKGSLEAMNAIRENTEPIPQIYELLQTIKRDGLKAI